MQIPRNLPKQPRLRLVDQQFIYERTVRRNRARAQKLFFYAVKRWMASRHMENMLAALRDRELDRVRQSKRTQRWFAAADRAQRQFRLAAA